MRAIHYFLAVLLFLLTGIEVGAQFRNSAGQNFPYATSLSSNDVFVIGTGIGSNPTNKNVRYSILAAQLASEIGAGGAASNFLDSATVEHETVNGSNRFNVVSSALTGIPQAGVTGLPEAIAAKLGTNQNPVLNPLMFGAVGDGTTDDTLSWSNAIRALNAGSGLVLDGLGKKYRITAPLPVIEAAIVKIQNGIILYDSTSGALFSKTNWNYQGVLPLAPGAQAQSHFTLESMVLLQVAGPATAGNVAVVLGNGAGSAAGSYGVNYTVRNNIMTNWWVPIYVNGAVQAEITHNTLNNSWSNAIMAVGGIDMLNINYNEMDNRRDYNPVMNTNAIAIYIEPSQAVFVRVHGNNGGGFKQIMKGSDIQRLHWSGNQWEAFYTGDTNLTKIELWNTVVFMEGDGLPGGFGSSNYLATVGLYAFGSQRNGLDKSRFEGVNGSFTFDVFSTNAFDADYQFPKVWGATPVVRRHTAWGDAGIVYTFGAAGTDLEQWDNATNKNLLNLYGDIIFKTGGTEWGRINRVGGNATISQQTIFSGAANFNHLVNFFNTTANRVLMVQGDKYATNVNGTGILLGTGADAVAGTHYLAPNGNGSALTALNASELGSGTTPIGRLGTNSPTAGSFLTPTNSNTTTVWTHDASSLSNAVSITAGANTTVTPGADGRSFEIASTGGGSGSNAISYPNLVTAVRTREDGAGHQVIEVLGTNGVPIFITTNYAAAGSGPESHFQSASALKVMSWNNNYLVMKANAEFSIALASGTGIIYATDAVRRLIDTNNAIAFNFENANTPVLGDFTYRQDLWVDGEFLVVRGTEVASTNSFTLDTINATQLNVGSMGVTNNLGVTNDLVVHGVITGNGSSITNIPLSSIQTGTNWVTTTPDYAKPWGLLTTNNNFAWLTPINFNTGRTNVDQCVRLVTNSAATLITFTAPAGYTATGTLNVTNGGVTMVTFTEHPHTISNLMSVPLK